MADIATHNKTKGTDNINEINNKVQLDFMQQVATALDQPIDYCKSYGEMRNWSIYITTEDYSIFIRYKNETPIDGTTDQEVIANWEKLGKYSIVTTESVNDTIQQEILGFWPGIRLAWFEIMTWITFNNKSDSQ